MERPLNLAKRMRTATPQRYSLSSLIQELLSALGPRIDSEIIVSVEVQNDIYIWVQREPILEAFRNIVDNGLRAVRDTGVAGALAISSIRRDSRRQVDVVFRDTGIGMTDTELTAAKEGFHSTRGSSGVGVLLSQVLIRAQGGTLAIFSTKGRGTRVIITLPLA